MKKNSKILSVVSASLALVAVFYLILATISYIVCFKTSVMLPDLNKNEFLKIQIFGSSYSNDGSTVSGEISILDSDEHEIAKIERSWSGSYLAIDFVSVNIMDKAYTFPLRIYGKNSISGQAKNDKNGTHLEKYYNYNNQCMLLGSGYTLEDRKNLYRLSSYATKKMSFFNFGHIRSFSVNLSNCKPYCYYSVSADNSGKVYISEI